jgi:two-component system sensor histidine kinase BarA
LWHRVLGSLQLRLLAIGSLPLLLLTVVFTAYAIFSRQGEVFAKVEEHGVRTADYLANTLDFVLFSNELAVLASVAADIQEVPGIRGVAFLDRERRLLHASPGFPGADQGFDPRSIQGLQAQRFGDALVVEREVRARPLGVEDYPVAGADSGQDQLLGWVVVAVDLAAARRAQRAIAVSSIGVGAAVLGTALLMALVLARSVVAPIRELTAVVARLRNGDLTARVRPSTRDELAQLAAGINHLGEVVAHNQLALEQQVAQATGELRIALEELRRNYRELEIAAHQAEAANLAKSDFLARMSHELRTPLTSVQGFVRLLEGSLPDAVDRSYCRIIDGATQALMALIDDILEFARLQSGAQRAAPAAFGLREILESAVRLLAPAAHGKGVEIHLDLDPGVPDTAIGDARALRQIVNNLLGNAVKFTASGFVLLRCSRTPDGGLHLLIRDTGIGIDPAQQAGVFDAFQQADSGIARRFGGTGLGLAITQQHVDLLGGRIELHSRPGAGSEFRVELPCQWPLAEPPPAPAAAGPAVVYDASTLGREAACAQLRRLYCEVRCVDSFDDLIDLMASRPIAALNVNWQLHESPSRQLAALRHLVDELRCPIAVQVPLAALHQDIPAEFLRAHPRVHWLGKPAGLEELRAALWPCPESSALRTADLSGVRVLAVEDNPFSRLLLNKLLVRTGCELLEVGDGRAAIEICQQRRFDVILMDLHMPGIAGVEALSHIQRAGECNADTPVIVLTADQIVDPGRELNRVRVERVLRKPYDEQLVLETVLQYAGRSGFLPAAWLGSREEVPREAYFDEIDRLLDEIDQSLAGVDLDAARGSCHQLAGIVAVFRLGELEQRAQLLHSLVRVSDRDRAAAMVARLRIENGAQRRRIRLVST